MQRREAAAAGSASAGYLVVISAPSGGGKTTVIRRLLEHRDPDFEYSISATTRPARQNEVHGRDYYFLSQEEFRARAEGNGFIEWAQVHGSFYGTPKAPVENSLNRGKMIFMDLDVQGGINVKKQYGERAILIFIMPPSMESLRQRLRERNTESPEAIERRLQASAAEMQMATYYDHTVVNHNLDDTVARVREIINEYRS